MVLFRRLIAGFRGVFHKTQLEQELDAELREFLETAVEEKIAEDDEPPIRSVT